jgi:P pilus assembly chaperone PapD
MKKNTVIIKRHLVTFIALGMLVASSFSQAALIVNRSIITYENPTVNREDVIIINSSEEENLYVQVEPFAVVNPGSNEQELLPLGINDNPEFLVTPNRLVTPPGGRSIVRFLNLLAPADEERVYRVNMVPITPPAELEESREAGVSSRLEVVVAYQVLVIILPASPNPRMDMSRAGNIATFTNAGNANYLLTDGEQCNPEDTSACLPLEDRRVYPGNEWQQTLPFDGPFTYKIRTQDGLTSEYFR